MNGLQMAIGTRIGTRIGTWIGTINAIGTQISTWISTRIGTISHVNIHGMDQFPLLINTPEQPQKQAENLSANLYEMP